MKKFTLKSAIVLLTISSLLTIFAWPVFCQKPGIDKHNNENTMKVYYLDAITKQWLPVVNTTTNRGAKTISYNRNESITYYALFKQPPNKRESQIENMPKQIELLDNYPNPFNPSTTIKFRVLQRSMVRLEVHNIMGQQLATLVNDVLEPGFHTVTWNGRDGKGNELASGIYLLNRFLQGETVSKSITLLK